MQATPLTHRFQRQIETLLDVFEQIDLDFQKNAPIDQSLSKLFRRQSKFGSKDRRFISGVVFGFYRWYGWLGQIDFKERKETALLLGYLLDGNEITPLIIAWGETLELSRDFFLNFECPGTVSIEKKMEVLSSFIPGAQISKLNPDWMTPIPDELTISFQKRANLWIRRKTATDDRILEFLDRKQITYKIHKRKIVAIEVLGTVNLSESKIYQQGKVEVQDISSQSVGWICNPRPGQVWWDMCAGSGGKALHLANLMKNSGRIFATEIRPTIMGELDKRIRRGKWNNIVSSLWEGKKAPDFQQDLDGVLVDAPCSCSGTWRRSPFLRWQLKKEALPEFQKTQLHLLKVAASRLQSDGVLVYATCSIFPEENEELIEIFLAKNSDFFLDEIVNPFVKKERHSQFKFTPLNLDGNAMYVARMKRK